LNTGTDTDHVKVVISQGIVYFTLNLVKYGKEIGGKSGKLSTESGKIGTFR